MILKLKYPVLLVILSAIFYSCEKEYSLEGATPADTAVFSFSGAPGACTSPVITGNYAAGNALTASETATISVDVSAIGSYTITTNNVNGVSFSGSGTFTSTGTQTVALTGTGIPLIGGSFSFTPGTTGCSFPVTFTGSTTTSGFTYKGAPNDCTNAVVAGDYFVGGALTAANTITIDVDVTVKGTWAVTTASGNGMTFSGTGTFADIGPQTIVLTGTGTPVSAGVYDYTPSSPTTTGCSFVVTVLTGAPNTDYLECTIDGVQTTFNSNLTSQKISVDTFNVNGQRTTDVNSPFLGINLTGSPSIGIGVYNRYSASNTSIFCIAAYIASGGTQPFVPGGTSTTDNFSVTVTSIANNRIVGTFSGTLYSDPVQGTGAKVITNGAFSVPFQ